MRALGGCKMAADTNNTWCDSQLISMDKQVDMQNLRDRGLEYVCPNGKVIPAKCQPAQFCHCPQRCEWQLARSKWEELFEQFYNLGDQTKQNAFLRTHIQIKRLVAAADEEGAKPVKNKRRVTCKYVVPILQPGENIDKYLYNPSENSKEICLRAFMNVFVLSEKRVRQQREANINGVSRKPKIPALREIPKRSSGNWLDNYNKPEHLTITPVQKRKADTPADLAVTPARKRTHQNAEDLPLDLSKPAESAATPVAIDIGKEKLYELASILGLSKTMVTQELVDKYEAMVRANLEKQQKDLAKQKKNSALQPACLTKPPVKDLSHQVIGLQDDLAILPMQSVNNGDLTITPVLEAPQPVLNYDIMQVNNFFHNQLWRPELIGLKAGTIEW